MLLCLIVELHLTQWSCCRRVKIGDRVNVREGEPQSRLEFSMTRALIGPNLFRAKKSMEEDFTITVSSSPKITRLSGCARGLALPTSGEIGFRPAHMAVPEGSRRRQDLASEGQRQLEEAVVAAFQILTSINHELCNPALWSSSSSSHQQEHQPTTVPAAPDSHTSADAEGGGGGAGPGGSLDEARHRYKTAVAALRASITAVSSSSQEIRSPDDKTDEDEIGKLEERASVLRKEIETKNKNVKLLMNQLREMILDVSMWQSPCPA